MRCRPKILRHPSNNHPLFPIASDGTYGGQEDEPGKNSLQDSWKAENGGNPPPSSKSGETLTDHLLLFTAKISVGVSAKTYNIRPASLNSIFQVGVNRTRNIQMLVTDEQNKPLADLPVRFTLKGAGSLGATMFSSNSIEVRTDAKGIATIPYNAGATTGTTPITAEVPGTNVTTTTTANVTRDEPGFFSWHGGFPAVVVASAAIGIGAGVWATKDKRSNLPIQGKGDAVLIP